MKIITLHQPWASLVALGLKRYETRHWPTSYRGPLLIHAAKRRMVEGEIDEILANLEGFYVAESLLEEALTRIHAAPHYGCIVAIAKLANCQLMVDGDEFFENPLLEGLQNQPININSIDAVPPLERAVGLWDIDRYAFQLDNARPLSEPIPFASRQGKLLGAHPALQLMVENQLAGRAA